MWVCLPHLELQHVGSGAEGFAAFAAKVMQRKHAVKLYYGIVAVEELASIKGKELRHGREV